MSKRLGAAACIAKPVDLRNLTRVTPQPRFQWALAKPPPAGWARIRKTWKLKIVEKIADSP